MLHSPQPTSPLARCRIRAALYFTAAAALVAAGASTPPAGAVQEHTVQPAIQRVEPSEEFLLRQALRYLRLSRSQLGQMVWVARQTDRRLEVLDAEEERGLAHADRFEARNPAEAERLRSVLRQNLARADDGVVAFALPHLVRLLTREQIALAWRLGSGSLPEYARGDKALLDPRNGFTQSRRLQEGLLDLGSEFSPSSLESPEGCTVAPPTVEMKALRARAAAARPSRLLAELIRQQLPSLPAAGPEETRALGGLQRGRLDDPAPRERLGETISGRALRMAGEEPRPFQQLVVETTDLGEVAPSVEPLARRLFLSRDLLPVLRDAQARGLGPDAAPRPRLAAGAPRRVRDYRIHQGFADLLGRGPELKPLGGRVQGGTYTFGPGQGLHLADTGVVDHYAVEMVFQGGSVQGYQKLIDFKKRKADTGLYLYQGRLTFYNVARGGVPVPGRDHHLRLERDRNTRIVRAFLDRRHAFAFIDLDDQAIFDKGESMLFVDDEATTGEQGPGLLASLLIWDSPARP